MIPPGTRARVLADGWFIPGTIATVVVDCEPAGVLMDGQRRCEKPDAEGGKPLGLVYGDEELCPPDEFDWNDDGTTEEGTR